MSHQSERGRFRIISALSAVALFVYQPVAWTAAPAVVGEISVKGSAEINGTGAVTGQSLFAGDHIVTREDSTTSVISRGGARLLVLGASAVQIKDSGGPLTALLGRGSVAAVSPAQAPLIVEAGGMRIVPDRRGSVYGVLLNGNKLKVMAHSGTVSVEAANGYVNVPEGKTLDATVTPPPANGEGGAGAAGGGSHLTDILIASTVALAATAIALGVVDATKTCTVSPSGVGTCQVK